MHGLGGNRCPRIVVIFSTTDAANWFGDGTHSRVFLFCKRSCETSNISSTPPPLVPTTDAANWLDDGTHPQVFLLCKKVLIRQIFLPFLVQMQLVVCIGKRRIMFFILRHARCIHLHQSNVARRAAIS